MPFFDGAFLETVMSAPAEWCLYHRLYTKWLNEFPPAVSAVPWQTYPEHEPCPLPMPVGIYQWSTRSREALATRERARFVALSGELLKGTFPDSILDKTYFRLASALYRTGLRDYGYVIRNAAVYQHYVSVSGGRYS